MPSDRIKKLLKCFDHHLNSGSFSHSMNAENAISLLKSLKVQKGDTFWEIGCGIPILAFVQLYMTRGTVVATDQCFIFIRYTFIYD